MEEQVEIGSRVIAISHNDGPVVYIFGYGTFDGYHLPPYINVEEAVAEIQAGYRDAQSMIPDLPAVLPDDTARTMLLLDNANPRITLESGKTVWGNECWWRSAQSFDDLPKPDGFQVIVVDIDEARAKAEAQAALDDLETITPEQMLASFKDIN